MNYYEARQRTVDGRWDWTCMNDKRVWRSPPCDGHEDGHATKEEAERHYYEYELTQLREIQHADILEKCSVCGAWTSKGLQKRHGTPTMLCDAHRTKEEYTRLYPFESGIRIISSW